MKGFLALEDGTVFAGESVGAEGFAFGEAVFTTAMTGYQEIVTDPSFAEQIVTFTAPMVGNYGVEQARSESAAPHARAVVMRDPDVDPAPAGSRCDARYRRGRRRVGRGGAAGCRRAAADGGAPACG